MNWEFVESSPRFIHTIQGTKVAFVKQSQRLKHLFYNFNRTRWKNPIIIVVSKGILLEGIEILISIYNYYYL